MKIKYPRTPHLSTSPGFQNDDRVIQSLDGFIGQEIIITEKMDGENSTLYNDHFHARSLDSRHHPSRDWLKRFHGEIAYMIFKDWRICGENLYAKHSIFYEDLKNYFYGFSIWDDRNVALSTDDQDYWFGKIGIVQPHTFYRGKFDLNVLTDIALNLNTEKHEGFVIRVTSEIPFDEFHQKVAKWVRPGHVQTDEHWMHQLMVVNQLSEKIYENS